MHEFERKNRSAYQHSQIQLVLHRSFVQQSIKI